MGASNPGSQINRTMRGLVNNTEREVRTMAQNGTSTSNGKQPVLVGLQLSGGNDFMNTVVPYGDPMYYDFRKTVGT